MGVKMLLLHWVVSRVQLFCHIINQILIVILKFPLLMLRLWALCASNISSNPRKLKGTPLMESEEVWIHEKLKLMILADA